MTNNQFILDDDTDEALQALVDCDGVGSGLLLNNQQLIKILKELNWLQLTTRHSHCGTEKLREINKNKMDEDLINVFIKECEKINIEVLYDYPIFTNTNIIKDKNISPKEIVIKKKNSLK